METVYPDIRSVCATPGVYAPQEDSLLLVEAIRSSGVAPGRSVLDVCTGSGVVAIAAAQLGARHVTAFDICMRAVRCTRYNAAAAGARVHARRGTCSDAIGRGPYELVVSNPPYLPVGPDVRRESVARESVARESVARNVGPSRAWDAGRDGRMVLDPMCASATELLAERGTLLIVQSEFADLHKTLRMLRGRGLSAEVPMTQIVPFGPVLTERAHWMEAVGLLPVGRREEELVVIRAEKP